MPVEEPSTASIADTFTAVSYRFYSITSSAAASSEVGTMTPTRLSGLEVNNKVEPGRLFNRNVGRTRSVKESPASASLQMQIASLRFELCIVYSNGLAIERISFVGFDHMISAILCTRDPVTWQG